MLYLLPQDGSSVIIGFGRGGQYGNSGDIVITERHSSEVQITEHAIEVGANITDHVRTLLKKFGCDVYLTNTPITTDEIMARGFEETIRVSFPRYKIPFEFTPGGLFRAVGGALGSLFSDPPKTYVDAHVLTFDTVFYRPGEVFTQLKAYQEAGMLFNILSQAQNYQDMAIEVLALPVDEPGGAQLTIEFKEIRTVSTSNVTAPAPLEKRGAPKKTTGSQATTTSKDAPKAASLALKALQAMGAVE